jgi:hypothetical protein
LSGVIRDWTTLQINPGAMWRPPTPRRDFGRIPARSHDDTAGDANVSCPPIRQARRPSPAIAVWNWPGTTLTLILPRRCAFSLLLVTVRSLRLSSHPFAGWIFRRILVDRSISLGEPLRQRGIGHPPVMVSRARASGAVLPYSVCISRLLAPHSRGTMTMSLPVSVRSAWRF